MAAQQVKLHKPPEGSFKMRVIRSLTSLPQITLDSMPKVTVVKKKVNIPICDTRVDADYDNIVKPTFQLPQSYIRHIRRIGDEADVSADCIVDLDDKLWLSKAKFAGEKEMRFLTHEAFETIINVFERHTGLSREPIPQSHADRLVAETLKWTPTLTAKLLPDVYAYWLRKREKLRKPLCRKYWPQTPAADNNPHLTFRPRDKERYRLRKQQRKNDIDSFRKMQQLRREFAHAQVLMELILEREQLKLASSEMRREIFEQGVYDVSAPGPESLAARPPRKAAPFTYALQCEHHLLKAPEAEPNFKLGADAGGAGGRDKLSLVQTAAALQKQQAEAEARRLKRQAASNMRRKREDFGGAGGGYGGGDGGYRGANAGYHNPDDYYSIHPSVPGPRVFCKPAWMPFIFPLPVSESGTFPRTVSDYLDELELRDEMPLPSKFRCRLRLGRSGRLCIDRVPVYSVEPTPWSSTGGMGLMSWGRGGGDDGADAGVAPPLPLAPGEGQFQGTYVYPTIFNSRLLKGASPNMAAAAAAAGAAVAVAAADVAGALGGAAGAGAGGIGGYRSGSLGGGGGGGGGGVGGGVGIGGNVGGDAVKVPHRQLFALPPTMPPERASVTLSLIQRQRDVYHYSDSEDEWVELEAAPRIARPKQRPYATLRF